VADEGDAEFSVSDEARFVGFTGKPSHSRAAHQTSELSGALAKGRIAERLLDHSTSGRFALFNSSVGGDCVQMTKTMPPDFSRVINVR
jgi:hypothetical protein